MTDSKITGTGYPFLDDVSGLSRGSRKQIRCACEACFSTTCKKVVCAEYTYLLNNIEQNGLFVCSNCSSSFDCCKKHVIDSSNHSVFEKINTEAKAYLLGWVASGEFTVCADGFLHVQTEQKNEEIISTLRNVISPSIRIDKWADFVGFSVKCPKMMEDVYDELARFPFPNPELSWAFLRGLFDSAGYLNKRVCGILIQEHLTHLKQCIVSFCGIKATLTNYGIEFGNCNAVDFLGKIYDTADPKYRLESNYEQYLNLVSDGTPVPKCRFVRMSSNAVAPSKNCVSDEGYDLTLIAVDKVISNDTIRFDTGIRIEPCSGWHIELLPRSSLSNSGWLLSNSVGLIDSSYRGSLKVCLTRASADSKPIELPFKGFQMVLRKNVHFLLEEAEELDDTKRGEGGFGSTNS